MGCYDEFKIGQKVKVKDKDYWKPHLEPRHGVLAIEADTIRSMAKFAGQTGTITGIEDSDVPKLYIIDLTDDYAFNNCELELVEEEQVVRDGNHPTNPKVPEHNTDGSKTTFYNIPSWVGDLDDLSEMLELRHDEFNVLKSIWGIALERKLGTTRHHGTDKLRDVNKMKFYANRIHVRIHKEK